MSVETIPNPATQDQTEATATPVDQTATLAKVVARVREDCRQAPAEYLKEAEVRHGGE